LISKTRASDGARARVKVVRERAKSRAMARWRDGEGMTDRPMA